MHAYISVCMDESECMYICMHICMCHKGVVSQTIKSSVHAQGTSLQYISN